MFDAERGKLKLNHPLQSLNRGVGILRQVDELPRIGDTIILKDSEIVSFRNIIVYGGMINLYRHYIDFPTADISKLKEEGIKFDPEDLFPLNLTDDIVEKIGGGYILGNLGIEWEVIEGGMKVVDCAWIPNKLDPETYELHLVLCNGEIYY